MKQVEADIYEAPEFFDPKPWLDAANILVASDEPMRALDLLELVPAYHRQFPATALLELKNAILAKLATAHFYQSAPLGVPFAVPNDEFTLKLEGCLRWTLIRDDVKRFNDQGVTPFILDLGAGEFWLPVYLDHQGLKFKYNDVNLDIMMKIEALDKLKHVYQKSPDENQPVIFVACEIIEHLHHEKDILVECRRHLTKMPNIVHISTPRHCYDNRSERLTWQSFGTLGHLRTYWLREFIEVVDSMFPATQYAAQFWDSKLLHYRGELK